MSLTGFFHRITDSIFGGSASESDIVESEVAGDTPSFENALTSDGVGWDSYYALLGGDQTGVAGIKVNERTMLKVAAVRQAIQTIAGDIACSTLQLHDNEAVPGEESVMKRHPTHHCVAIRWSRYRSAYESWKLLVVHSLLWGNGYAYIHRDARGRIEWMSNLAPGTCRPDFEVVGSEEVPGYIIHVDSESTPFFVTQGDVFHLRGLSLDSLEAEDVVRFMRDTISVMLGAQKFEGAFFANGAQAGGIVTVPPGVPSEARERLESQIQKKANAENWFKTMVLRDGAQWHATTVDARSAEMTAIMEAGVRDVARFFNLPPFKLGLTDSVSYNSSEQGQRVYLTGCLNHWLKAITAEAHLKLLPSHHQVSGRYRFEHNVSKLVEPDFKTLNEVLAMQRQNEIISCNEYRKKINLPLLADKDADTRVNPNTKSNSAGGTSEDQGAGKSDKDKEETQKPQKKAEADAQRYRVESQLLEEAVARAAKRVCTPVTNRAKRPDKLLLWIDTEHVEHRSPLQDELGTTLSLIYGDDAGNKLEAIEDVFFSELLASVRPYTEPPYTEAHLHENVTNACSQFSQRIFSVLQEKVLTQDSSVC